MKNHTMSRHNKTFDISREKLDIPHTMGNHHYHNNLEVYYLSSGERYYFIKDKTYHIKKGSLVFIKELDIHSTANVKNLGHERFVFNFDRDYLSEFSSLTHINLFEYFDNEIHVVELDPNDQIFVEQILTKMCEEVDYPKANQDTFLKTCIIQILLIALKYKKSISVGNETLSVSKNIISEISAYINHNYGEDISLKTLSERFYISVYHLSRTFKKETGISFIDYLNNVRVKEAIVLLTNSDLNITQISEKVGYRSVTHFGRVFKNITGISPLVYKKTDR